MVPGSFARAVFSACCIEIFASFDKATNKVLAVSGDEGVLMTVAPEVDLNQGKIDPPIEL